ncbi:MAG: hypothetical protein AAGA17_00275 [Actinomycetota bacterium]
MTSTLDTLRALDEDTKADLWAKWPDHIPPPPGPWTPAQEAAINASIDARVGFNADADPRVLGEAKARLMNSMRDAGVTLKDQMAAVLAFADADIDTYDGVTAATQVLDRIAAGELVVHVDDEDDGVEYWTVVEAGEGSELGHRRAVTAMTNRDGWRCVVTVQHPTGTLWTTVEIDGTAAHSIANTVLKHTEPKETHR